MNEVSNPFGGGDEDRAVDRYQRNAITDVALQRELAQVQGAILMARRFPRDERAVTEQLLRACTRQSLAEVALYSYSRGGTEITGPSIRLAEAAAQAWSNLDWGVRELEQADGESTLESFCWDLQQNVRQSRVFQVPHIRHTKSGAYKLTDPRDIYEATANFAARRLRACILGVIPGDVIEAAIMQCEETLRTTADTSPDALKKVLAAFAEFGVTQGQIEARIQCKLEAIRPAQLVQLRKVFQSMRDGMSAAADWFPAAPATTADAKTSHAEKGGNAALRRRMRKDAPQQPQEAATAGDAPEGHEDAAPAPDASGPQLGAAAEAVSEDAAAAEKRALDQARIAKGLLADIAAAKTADDLRDWDRNPAVRTLLKRLEDEASPHWQVVNDAAQAKMADLKKAAQP